MRICSIPPSPQAIEKEGFYTANLQCAHLTLIDNERNRFVLRGDQTVDYKLAVSMNDEGFVSANPACAFPMLEYMHPDAPFLPVPSGKIPPRLFLIYPDGEAEELLESSSVESAFAEVADNNDAVCVRDEPLSDPLRGCRSNTIFKLVKTLPQRLPYHEPIILPNIIRGLTSPLDKIEPQFQLPLKEFTTFRQFVE